MVPLGTRSKHMERGGTVTPTREETIRWGQKRAMGTKESTQEMTETREFDLPQDGFRLKDHPWLAADITVEDEIRYALDEIRL